MKRQRATNRVLSFSVLLASISLAGASALEPQPDADEPPRLSTSVGPAHSTEELPAHVQAENGELTLFADFTDVRGDHVVLYLVNLTDRRIGFAAQDDDPYVKLEAVNESGQWERAQRHVYSWCGNSYFGVPALSSGEFFRFLGYYPADGEPADVRYRVFRETAFVLEDQTPDQLELLGMFSKDLQKIPLNLVSNVGKGLVRESDVTMARYDKLALRFGSFDAVREMALGLAEPTTPTWRRWSRQDAVDALQRFSDERAAAVFETLLDDEDEMVRQAAIRGLGIIGPQCAVAEQRFQELLKGADVERRAAAIWALSARPMNPSIIDDLRIYLNDPEARIRAAAIAALAMVCREFPEAHRALQEHNDDPDVNIRSVLKNVDGTPGWCRPATRDSKATP